MSITPYRGVNGFRRRERDEPVQRDDTARYYGICAETGAAIRPGDLVQYNSAGRTVLVCSRRPGAIHQVAGDQS